MKKTILLLILSILSCQAFAQNDNYYQEEQIDDTGVGKVKNPFYIQRDINSFKYVNPRMNVGQYFDSDSKYDKDINASDIERALNNGLTVDDLINERRSLATKALVNQIIVATVIIIAAVALIWALLAFRKKRTKQFTEIK